MISKSIIEKLGKPWKCPRENDPKGSKNLTLNAVDLSEFEQQNHGFFPINSWNSKILHRLSAYEWTSMRICDPAILGFQ